MYGGILSPKISTFIKKRILSLSRSRALGSILGATGIATWWIYCWSSINFLTHNQIIKNLIEQVLFGND